MSEKKAQCRNINEPFDPFRNKKPDLPGKKIPRICFVSIPTHTIMQIPIESTIESVHYINKELKTKIRKKYLYPYSNLQRRSCILDCPHFKLALVRNETKNEIFSYRTKISMRQSRTRIKWNWQSRARHETGGLVGGWSHNETSLVSDGHMVT